MKSIHVIIGCCILFLLASCVSPINCRKQFTIYKNPNNNIISECGFLKDGVFVSLNGKNAFYLYNDGLVKSILRTERANQLFWVCPEKEIYKILPDDEYFKKEIWGHYQIINDTILIQTFGLSNDQLCRRSVYETKGVVLNDSTIEVFSYYSYWFESEFIKEPNIYRFYKTEQKPDSTLAWFNKKRWYKKNLHESRR